MCPEFVEEIAGISFPPKRTLAYGLLIETGENIRFTSAKEIAVIGKQIKVNKASGPPAIPNCYKASHCNKTRDVCQNKRKQQTLVLLPKPNKKVPL